MNDKDSMKPTRLDYEKLLDEIEKLREEAESTPIIVEGKKDEISLRCMGIAGKFLEVSNGLPLYEFCEKIAERHSDAILFTDFDRAGHKLAQRLTAQLEQMGVRVNGRYRLSLMSRLDTNQVENLHKRLAKFRQKAGVRVHLPCDSKTERHCGARARDLRTSSRYAPT